MPIINGRNPDINPTTGEIISGFGQIYLNDVPFAPTGFLPKWVTTDEIVYNNNVATVLQNVRTRAVLGTFPIANAYAGGGGKWGLFISTGVGETQLYTGTTLTNTISTAGAPAIDTSGNNLYYEPFQATSRNLLYNGSVIVTAHQIRDISLSTELIVWTEDLSGTGEKITFGSTNHGGTITNMAISGNTFEVPVAVDTPTGPWILGLWQTGLALRPAGATTNSFFFPGGNFFNPTAKFVGGNFIIASATIQGLPNNLILSPSSGSGNPSPPTPAACS